MVENKHQKLAEEYYRKHYEDLKASQPDNYSPGTQNTPQPSREEEERRKRENWKGSTSRDKLDETKERVKEKFEDAKDFAKEKWSEAKNYAEDESDRIKRKSEELDYQARRSVGNLAEKTSDIIDDTRDKTKQTLSNAQHQIRDSIENVREKTYSAWDSTKDAARSAERKVEQFAENAKERVEEGWDKAKDTAARALPASMSHRRYVTSDSYVESHPADSAKEPREWRERAGDNSVKDERGDLFIRTRKQIEHAHENPLHYQKGYEDKTKEILDTGYQFKERAKENIGNLENKWDNLKESAKESIVGSERTIKKTTGEMKDRYERSKDDIKQEAAREYSKAKGGLASTWGNAKEKAEEAWEGTKETAKGVYDNSKRDVDRAKDKAYELKEEVERQYDTHRSSAKGALEQVKDTLVNTYEKAKDVVEDKLSDVKEVVSQKVEDAKDTVSHGLENAKEAVVHRAEDAKETVNEKLEEAKSQVSARWEDTKSTAEKLVHDAEDKYSKTKEDLKENVREFRRSQQVPDEDLRKIHEKGEDIHRRAFDDEDYFSKREDRDLNRKEERYRRRQDESNRGDNLYRRRELDWNEFEKEKGDEYFEKQKDEVDRLYNRNRSNYQDSTFETSRNPALYQQDNRRMILAEENRGKDYMGDQIDRARQSARDIRDEYEHRKERVIEDWDRSKRRDESWKETASRVAEDITTPYEKATFLDKFTVGILDTIHSMFGKK